MKRDPRLRAPALWAAIEDLVRQLGGWPLGDLVRPTTLDLRAHERVNAEIDTLVEQEARR